MLCVQAARPRGEAAGAVRTLMASMASCGPRTRTTRMTRRRSMATSKRRRASSASRATSEDDGGSRAGAVARTDEGRGWARDAVSAGHTLAQCGRRPNRRQQGVGAERTGARDDGRKQRASSGLASTVSDGHGQYPRSGFPLLSLILGPSSSPSPSSTRSAGSTRALLFLPLFSLHVLFCFSLPLFVPLHPCSPPSSAPSASRRHPPSRRSSRPSCGGRNPRRPPRPSYPRRLSRSTRRAPSAPRCLIPKVHPPALIIPPRPPLRSSSNSTTMTRSRNGTLQIS